MRAWPRIVTLALGLIPVGVLAGIVVSMAVKAAPANDRIGVRHLFGMRFSSIYTTGQGLYGLTPAIWGSVEVTVIAMLLAIPASLALAVFATEYAPGIIGRAMRVMLAIMGGIPPVVYAIMAVVFIAPFMRPKFTGNFTFSTVDPQSIGVDPKAFPPPGLPWNPGSLPFSGIEANSILLAGILLALLVIPFMAPMIEDALRNVPREAKEASSALGTTRWDTLKRITLPQAMPGIISAIRLGMLRVLGDVIIVMFVVGFEAVKFPYPAWDIFEKTSPLTAEGSGLIGGLIGPNSCAPEACSAGYFSASLLLIMALVVILVMTGLERRARRRLL